MNRKTTTKKKKKKNIENKTTSDRWVLTVENYEIIEIHSKTSATNFFVLNFYSINIKTEYKL